MHKDRDTPTERVKLEIRSNRFRAPSRSLILVPRDSRSNHTRPPRLSSNSTSHPACDLIARRSCKQERGDIVPFVVRAEARVEWKINHDEIDYLPHDSRVGSRLRRVTRFGDVTIKLRIMIRATSMVNLIPLKCYYDRSNVGIIFNLGFG